MEKRYSGVIAEEKATEEKKAAKEKAARETA